MYYIYKCLLLLEYERIILGTNTKTTDNINKNNLYTSILLPMYVLVPTFIICNILINK